jgi:peptidoglycan L-alanyl-D-glutamate endopeptidase CwlK
MCAKLDASCKEYKVVARNNLSNVADRDAELRTTHVVNAGETLIAIAKRHGVTLKALLAENPQIKDANRIKVGQTIKVPPGRVVVPIGDAAPAGVGGGVLGGAVLEDARVLRVIAAGDSPAFLAIDARRKTKGLHPVFRERLVMLAEILAGRSMKALITDGLRTFDEQDKLFQKGRRGIPGEQIVTKARGGQSNHNYGLAVDLYPVLPDSAGKEKVFTSIPKDASVEFGRAFSRIQNAIGDGAEGLGLFWGARFAGIVDTPHIQLLAEHDMSAKECLKIFRDNGDDLEAVWLEVSRRVKPLNP